MVTFTSNEGLGFSTGDLRQEAVAAAEAAQAAAELAQAGAETAETNAETAEAGAVAAQAATESIFDQFGDQYLGPKASDPTVDNDGDPLTSGDIYFNTTDSVLKFYSGSAWVAPESIATTAASDAQAAQAAAATSETNAATSLTDAESARDQSQAARDTANLHKLAAEAAATSATNTASALTGFDLDAIAETKGVTAVDVFVYDTSKDSDGGAWRKRTQGTSWYNEALNTATRGSRREFPAVAVIVMTNVQLTIYDGDDPDLPMWMVFENAGSLSWASGSAVLYSSVSALNGKIVPASTTGAVIYDFIADDTRLANVGAYELTNNKALVSRNGATSFISGGNGYAIVSSVVNDVDMTILPDSPIDPATGLPVPTIAVATGGGVSVIKDDGTVVDSAATLGVGGVFFDANNGIFYRRDTTTGILWYSTAADYLAGDGFGDEVARPTAGTNSFDLLAYSSTQKNLDRTSDGFAFGGVAPTDQATPGLMLHQPNYTDQSKGMSALLTSTYNTGWMNGSIKGAFLSDTDDTDLVGSGELVTNGDFSAGVSDFSLQNATYTVASGEAEIAIDAGSTAGGIHQDISVVSGQTYTVSATVRVGTGADVGLRIQDSNSFTSLVVNETTSSGTNVTLTGTWTPTSTTNKVYIRVTNAAGETAFVDNISVKLADADRSVNNNGLVVTGSIARDPVATGADLVAYSGFSSSNYLTQPYNSDLDFGTGDFCVMGWIGGTKSGQVFDRLDPSEAGARFSIILSGSYTRFFTSSGFFDAPALPNGQLNFVVMVRRSGVLYGYVDGNLVGSTTCPGSITNTSANLRVGTRANIGSSPILGSLLLWRISATAPTAEQIAKIYNDEKVLFQENAQATLYGSSDAVTALAHDPDTDLLHVGTSAGRSVFQGLRRVSNTTTAVGTAISASNGLVVEE